MANQAFSEAADLMVGAGEVYFKRKDDVGGFHHLGNVEEMNITTDVTTVEKNSSMNKRRELMASVVTAVAPSASLTMNEYNPYNMALGLYGVEAVHKQAAQTLTAVSYTVPVVPGIVNVVDADGNRYYNMKVTAVAPANPVASSIVFNGGAGTYVDSAGGTISLNASSSYTGSTAQTLYVRVQTACTTAGDVAGLVLQYDTNAAFTNPQAITLTTGSGSSDTATIASLGITLDITLGASDNFTVSTVQAFTMVVSPAKNTLTSGVDYIVEEQSGRAGMIKIPTTSSLKAGDAILVTATIPAEDYVTVSGADAGEIEGELLYVADNNQGDNYVIEAWNVKVTPDGDLSGLISEDFGSFSLSVKFLADRQNHPDYPYYKVTKVGTASGTNSSTGTYDPLN